MRRRADGRRMRTALLAQLWFEMWLAALAPALKAEEWGDWVDWSVCQFTCGGGESVRPGRGGGVAARDICWKEALFFPTPTLFSDLPTTPNNPTP